MASRTVDKYGKKVDFNGKMEFVRLGQMKVSPLAQRELRQHRVDYLYSIFDPDKLGIIRVSKRGGHFYIVDGQHRIEALKLWNGPGWEDVAIPVWVVSGLTENQEAEYFLSLADVLSVNAFQKFKIALTAGRDTEVELASIVESVNLKISHQHLPGVISAVTSLLRSFKRDGPEAFRKTLVISKNAFGDAGLIGPVIDGLGLMCHRYNSVLDEKTAIEKLSRVNGSVNGLLNIARGLRVKTGQNLNHCIAAAAVSIINRGVTEERKLAEWFPKK